MTMVMWAIIGCGLLSLVYGAYTVRAVMAVSYTHLTLPTIYSV